MKQVKLLCGLALVALFSVSSHATILVSGFNTSTYSDGALVGQNGWVQVATDASRPLTLSSGSLSLYAGTGQDAAHDLGGSYTDTTLYYAGTISVASASATGGFFIGLSTDTTASTNGRVFVQSNGTGFILGVSAGTTAVYPSSPTVLNFNQSYRFVVSYTQSSSSVESIRLYINPTDLTSEAGNTAYDSTSGNANTLTAMGAIQLIQGTSTAPGMTLSDFVLATTFSEVAAVPEPSTMACLLASCLVLVTVVSRRRSSV